MARCLELAAKGIKDVAPNPMVGSVIVYNEEIIGEGYHRVFGGHHAEVCAIERAKDHPNLQDATLYVNLEPCAHHGKTPPCCELITSMGIGHVVTGAGDPNPKVAGQGIAHLEAHGVKVEQGIMEEACRELNKRFFTAFEKNRPYVILKWAQSQDGFMDIDRNGEKGVHWISTKQTKRLVHTWRAEEQAILVGSGTVVNDNPSLTVRSVEGPSPTRIVLGPVDKRARIFDGTAPTLHFEQIELTELLRELMDRKLHSVLVEGGAETLQQFIDAGVWDEARIIHGQGFIGQGLKAPRIDKEPEKCYDHFGDTIHIIRNR